MVYLQKSTENYELRYNNDQFHTDTVKNVAPDQIVAQIVDEPGLYSINDHRITRHRTL